ncbi:MAG: ABC transporter permease [Caldilineaceae bacterium]
MVFAPVGEIFTERAGILNLGLEGILIMGAVTAFAVGYHTDSLLIAVLVAMVVGGLMATIHAFLTITLRADQVVSGLALTLFGIGLSSFLGQRLGPDGAPLVGLVGPKFTRAAIPLLSDIPGIGPALFNQDPLVYLMYIGVPVAACILYRTRTGCICVRWARIRPRRTQWASQCRRCATWRRLPVASLWGWAAHT